MARSGPLATSLPWPLRDKPVLRWHPKNRRRTERGLPNRDWALEAGGELIKLGVELSMSKPANLPENLPGLWRISKYFWPHARNCKGLMATSLMALFAEVGLRLLEPWPLKFVFDRLLGNHSRDRLALLPRFDGVDPMTLLTVAAAAVVVITGLRSIASYWQTIGFAQIGNRVLRKVRTQLYRHVQYL